MKDSFPIKVISLEERARVKKRESPRGRIILGVMGKPENKSAHLENGWKRLASLSLRQIEPRDLRSLEVT